MKKISGIVTEGKGKGKNLGFPTVNLELRDEIKSGVYSGKVKISEKEYKAGIFVSRDKKILEAHILDFDGDLFRKRIEVELGKRIREVMKFDNDEELKKQIQKDLFIIRNS